MKFSRFLFALNVVLLFSVIGRAQLPTVKKQITNAPEASFKSVKSTAAYAEVILRRTELESILEDLLVAYTDDFPKVRETKYELNLIESDLAKLLAAGGNPANLSPALGKLMVRRAALAADLWSLQSRFGDDHPDVKRARRRVSIFDKAVAEIFP